MKVTTAKTGFEIKEIRAKGVLTKCGIPGIDWVVNPYIGCRFGCKYCYASFMGRFVGKKINDWGGYVYPKINAPELLKKEVEKKLPHKGKGKEIFLSSVTDPYQGLEAKYQLTRQCLSVLADWGFVGTLPQAIPMMPATRSDMGPICIIGLSVRCPFLAAVSSPWVRATHACINSWQHMENTTSTSWVKYAVGSSKSRFMAILSLSGV